MSDDHEQQPGFVQRMMDKRAEWAAERPSFSAEIKAMAREGIKDVRSSVNEVFFDSPEYGGEPGTPLNPTPQMVTQDLGTVQGSYQDMLDTYASRSHETERENEKGQER
jgi:hypothetical protein